MSGLRVILRSGNDDSWNVLFAWKASVEQEVVERVGWSEDGPDVIARWGSYDGVS